MVRSVLSVVAGYAVAALLTGVTDFIVGGLFFGGGPAGSPAPAWFAVLNLAYSFLFAVVAGYVTAVVAKRSEVIHALALGVLMVVLGVAYLVLRLRQPEGTGAEPLWYLVALPVLALVATLGGGYLRARRRLRLSDPPRPPSD